MASGRNKSLQQLFLEHYSELFRHLVGRLRSHADAADVAQETFLKVSRLDQSVGIDNPRSYLFRIADNAATDHHRRLAARSKLVGEEPHEDVAADTPSPEEQVDFQQRVAILQQILQQLPARQRQVFVMHKFDGLSHAEIAAQLNISRSAVEKLIMKALSTCRDRLGRELQ